MKRVSRGWIFLGVWTGGMLAFLYLPIVPLIVNSFNRSRRGASWQGFTLQWYRAMWHDAPLMRAAANSLYIAAAVTALSVTLGTLGAWVVYRYRVPLKKVLATSVAVPLIVPEVIMGVSLLIFFSVVGHITNRHDLLGRTTIIIAHTTFCFPFVLIAVHARLVGMDPSMEEAAMSLGATPMQALVRVIVPYLLPAIFSGALMAFTLSMDELIVTYFVAGPQSQTLPVRIFGMARVGLNPTLNAISTLFIVGTAIIVFVGAGVWYRGAMPQSRET
jgi:spermidine/putrescine transport system permease protein